MMLTNTNLCMECAYVIVLLDCRKTVVANTTTNDFGIFNFF